MSKKNKKDRDKIRREGKAAMGRIYKAMTGENMSRTKKQWRYCHITVVIETGTRDCVLFLKLLEPFEGHLFNHSRFEPVAGAKEYIFTIGKGDFSAFFCGLNIAANQEHLTAPIEGLPDYRELAAGWLGDLIYHLYGYAVWGEGRGVLANH